MTTRNARQGKDSLDFGEERREVSFDIVSHIGALSTSQSGWKKEVNIVSWNGKQPRLDVRDWNPEHSKMGRGIGLNGPETENLLALLKGFDYRSAGI